jgi:hypothetical protein
VVGTDTALIGVVDQGRWNAQMPLLERKAKVSPRASRNQFAIVPRLFTDAADPATIMFFNIFS